AYVDLAPMASYLPQDAVVVLEDPASLTAELRAERDRILYDEAARAKHAHFRVEEFYEPEEAVAALLGERQAVCLHRTGVEGAISDPDSLERFESTPANSPTLATFDQADLERAIRTARTARGKGEALDPLVRRIRAWQDAGLRVLITARAQTQVERLV